MEPPYVEGDMGGLCPPNEEGEDDDFDLLELKTPITFTGQLYPFQEKVLEWARPSQ